eukprot:TRINITY_DN3009_c0_g1_i1.p1 TRINITY_DN3009_c0_g1~~TRINITY_DN3009_c0_g1_i1.p1  ORF type:complete len:575 (-),score=130.09 TRINITY_DN3009_c0_g1_i1:768-2492(-)
MEEFNSASQFAQFFNQANFSDRVLRLEILSDSESAGEAQSQREIFARRLRRKCQTLTDSTDGLLEGPYDAMSDAEPLRSHTEDEGSSQDEGGINNVRACKKRRKSESVVPEGEAREAESIGLAEEAGPPVSREGENSEAQPQDRNGAALRGDTDADKQVETVHISSAIIAAKSQFFLKLFSNGMRESEQREATLRIKASEKEPLLDLLQFMYSGKLKASTPMAVLEVLTLADKFEVVSCIRHCSQLLKDMPMTVESSLLYLDLPSTVQQADTVLADAVRVLTNAAADFLVERFKDLNKCQEEAMQLPIEGMEAVLASDMLQVSSEDNVYDFALKWARARYPNIDERKEVLSSKLMMHIRYPFMSNRKLKRALCVPEFEGELVRKFILEALFFRAEPPHTQKRLMAEEMRHKRFKERAYKVKPVKAVVFDQPCQQCLVFLDLKREDVAKLHPSGRMLTQSWNFNNQEFYLSAHCSQDQNTMNESFGLFLGLYGRDNVPVQVAVDYEFAARVRTPLHPMPVPSYVPKAKSSYLFTGGKVVGYRNLFSMPWKLFLAEESPFFINGVLHLRAELTVKT